MIMAFLRMHLGIGKRNCKMYKYSDSNNFKSFKQGQQLSNCTLPFQAIIYTDCYMCGKEYTSWRGLFYHKRKVHNCTNVYSRQYELELELNNSVKPEKKNHPNACFVLKRVIIKKKWKCITGRCIEIVSRGLSVKLVVVDLLGITFGERNSKIILDDIMKYILKRRVNIFYFIMHFCPGSITTHAESINSDLQRGLDIRLRHTALNTEQNQ